MKIIELENDRVTLNEVMALANGGPVVLRQPDGAMFALAPVDEFAVEVEILKTNPEFMAFLKELSQEKATISIGSLRKELGL